MNPTTLARRGVKTAALPLGALSRRRAEDLVILLYHRVGGPSGEIDMPLDAFERQLLFLLANEPVRTLDDALAGAGGVVITFDDGSRDFHEHVVPLLDRLKIPAVLYLATGPVATAPGDDPDAITWSQLEEAVSTGLITIGSHTHSHRSLARASRAEADDEMVPLQGADRGPAQRRLRALRLPVRRRFARGRARGAGAVPQRRAGCLADQPGGPDRPLPPRKDAGPAQRRTGLLPREGSRRVER